MVRRTYEFLRQWATSSLEIDSAFSFRSVERCPEAPATIAAGSSCACGCLRNCGSTSHTRPSEGRTPSTCCETTYGWHNVSLKVRRAILWKLACSSSQTTRIACYTHSSLMPSRRLSWSRIHSRRLRTKGQHTLDGLRSGGTLIR